MDTKACEHLCLESEENFKSYNKILSGCIAFDLRGNICASHVKSWTRC
jgi:hypothetical protein